MAGGICFCCCIVPLAFLYQALAHDWGGGVGLIPAPRAQTGAGSAFGSTLCFTRQAILLGFQSVRFLH
jgi:hypothetical protein